MPALIRAALAAAAIAITLPAQADTERPLVVDVTTLSPSPRTGPIQEFIEENTPLKPGSYPIVSLADPDLAERLRWRMPTRSAADCSAAAPPLGQAVRTVFDAWNQLDLDTALSVARQTREQLPCQAEVLRKQDLKTLIFLEAAAHFSNEDGQAAATFAELAALYPDAEPEPGFPPEIQQSFRQAAASARAAPSIDVIISSNIAAFGPVVDGIPVPEGAGRITVKSGRHIVQINGPRGEVRTELFTVFPGMEENLDSVGQIVPDRPQAVGATMRAQITSGRIDALVAQGLSRYAEANAHPYLLFIVPDTSGASPMKILTLDPSTQSLTEGPPADLQALPAMADAPRTPGPSATTDPGRPSGTRRYDPNTVRRRLRVEPTPMRAGLALGFLFYDGAPFVTLEPRFDVAVGPISLMVTGLYGFGPREGGGLAQLPGLRLGVLKRFYVGRFAPHGGLGYEVIAARVARASGQDLLVLEGTPEVFGGTEFALNDTGLRLTARAGVAWTPGVVVLGDDSLESAGRLAISTAIGAAWTW